MGAYLVITDFKVQVLVLLAPSAAPVAAIHAVAANEVERCCHCRLALFSHHQHHLITHLTAKPAAGDQATQGCLPDGVVAFKLTNLQVPSSTLPTCLMSAAGRKNTQQTLLRRQSLIAVATFSRSQLLLAWFPAHMWKNSLVRYALPHFLSTVAM